MRQPARHGSSADCYQAATRRGAPCCATFDQSDGQTEPYLEEHADGDFVGEPDSEEEVDDAADPDLNWVDNVVDWFEFGNGSDQTAGTNLPPDSEVPWLGERDKIKRFLRPNLRQLRAQTDFVGLMPIPDKKVHEKSEPTPPHELSDPNPDWDEWAYRAYTEKQKRKAKERIDWNYRRACVGQFQYIQVNEKTDVRLQVPWEEPQRDWTNEEIWNFITLDGVAADPRSITLEVADPMGKADLMDTGGRYTESTEEFLARKGHLLEREPTQDDLADLGITQLAGEFEGFETPGEADGGPDGSEIPASAQLADGDEAADLAGDAAEGLDD